MQGMYQTTPGVYQAPIEVLKGHVITSGSISQRSLLDYVRQNHAMFRPPETQAMLTCVVEAVQELIADNYVVNINGLGSFKPRIYRSGGERRISVLFTPHPELVKGLKKRKFVDVVLPDYAKQSPENVVTDQELKRRYDKQRRAKK